MIMEEVDCALCGQRDEEDFLERGDRLHTSPATFRYVRCRHCGLIYLNPRPIQSLMESYYPDRYEGFIAEKENILFRLGARYRMVKRCRAVMARCGLNKGRLLDVGCATGDFLVTMRREGWEVYGVEPMRSAAQEAQRRLGEKISHGLLEEASFPDAYFDVVTLWDVLEHLHTPLSSLSQIHRILSPDGLMVLGVPHLASFDAALFGRYWIGWDAPRHLYAFDSDVLKALLSNAGFIAYDRSCFYGGYGAFYLSLRFYLEERVEPNKAREILLLLSSQRLLRYLLWPYFRTSYILNRGPVMVYFCKKAEAFP